MAKGTVTDEFVVVSHVRTGLKRELQFVLRSQSEICGGESLGRTRARKILNGGSGCTEEKTLNGGSGLKTGRKKKRVGKCDDFVESDGAGCALDEDEAKSDVVDIEEGKGDSVESMSKRLFVDNVEESALVDSVEPMCVDDDQEKKKREEEDNVPVFGKCKEESEKDEEMENGHCIVAIDGEKHEHDIEMEQHEKGLLTDGGQEEVVVDTEADVSCCGGISLPSKPISNSCSVNGVKLQNGLADGKFQRRLMVNQKVEGGEFEANGDAKQINLEIGVNEYTKKKDDFRKQNSVGDSCVDSSHLGFLTPCADAKPEIRLVDKPLRRFTRSVVKQEADSNNSNVRNNAEPSSLGKVKEEVSEVETDGALSAPVASTQNRGRPKKLHRNFPARLKDLFDTGILEGLTVYYLRGAKIREAGTTGLKGVIKGSGILCFCSACRGAQVVSPDVFESHASSTNKQPLDYILLETGKTLCDVMNACREPSLFTLEEKLQLVVGPTMKKSSLCFNCQGPLTEPCDRKTLVLCKSCLEIKKQEKASQTSPPKVHGNVERLPEPRVIPVTVPNESKFNSPKSNNKGRLTRKDVRLHKLVFEDDILPDGTEVGYFVAGKKMLVGYKKAFGIHCSCCNTVVSPSQFEAHAGCASRRKPFQHIYTTNGVSLHELSVALSRDQKFSIQENDDLCSICKDGGDLLCCDTCPRSFHTVCASLSSLPTGKWSCKWCTNMLLREKFVECNANALAAGRVIGVDAIAQITKRCIRIVSSLGSGLPSVCVLCRGHSFSRLGFNPRTVIICDQCEKEFHVGCLKEHKIADLKELPEGRWFCGSDCEKIHTSLQNLIIHGDEKLDNNFLKFIRKKQKLDEEDCSDGNTDPDIRWRVLRGKMAASDDTKALLARAVAIFHERFDPICHSGARGDLIPAMVYGRQVKDQDFSGMYCTILTVNEVIVSVGVFRIFGSELAELPLVATSNDCQGQGYFQCLFACIQRLLGFLKVKHMVLPAADEAKSIWTDKFGFTKMSDDEVDQYRKDFQVMVFDGTSMLRKPVPSTINIKTQL
ncbi:PREDICTED: uncharacterized protein LOC104826393 isoform X2 [Tarenaya hassleriana]|uniref:uncharacterized protein LOC104826393 isoform X2 n=1 Tax=Tarenaya hassleriana TaxID=28532 RepID=UPI00053C7A35|nr:PREDICTED: uncharacterized protein LOC104826393 isoform X2 [Tarenaya hassleriana]